MEAFEACFADLDDPRTGNAGLHNLHEILFIALCTVLCGGQTAVDMHIFARAKEGFLRGFRRLPKGLLSHGTFSRWFRLFVPDQFRLCFKNSMALFPGPCRELM